MPQIIRAIERAAGGSRHPLTVNGVVVGGGIERK